MRSSLAALLAARDYEAAFSKALSAQDVSTVAWLCRQLDPSVISDGERCALSQVGAGKGMGVCGVAMGGICCMWGGGGRLQHDACPVCLGRQAGGVWGRSSTVGGGGRAGWAHASAACAALQIVLLSLVQQLGADLHHDAGELPAGGAGEGMGGSLSQLALAHAVSWAWMDTPASRPGLA